MEPRKPLFAVLLGNLVTSGRIWASLGDKHQHSTHDLKNIALYNGPLGDNCECWSGDGAERSKVLADLREFILNESQSGSVLSCLSGLNCNHRPMAKLIWGPPGTGKTKTVSGLLWSLLAQKCRTLTCAPTNVAVMQITTRLMGMLKERIPSSCSSGDLLLYGNEGKLKIKDQEDLRAIFLKHRVAMLLNCLAPTTGWNHQLEEMKALLEHSITDYNRVRKMKDFYMTLKGYFSQRFVAISDNLKECMKIFQMHLPSSMMSN